MPVQKNKLQEKAWGKNYQALWEILEGKKRHSLMVEIHLDPTYWHQSHANLKRYNGEEWHLVAYLPHTEISQAFASIPGNIHAWDQGYEDVFRPHIGFQKLEAALLDEFRLIEGF